MRRVMSSRWVYWMLELKLLLRLILLLPNQSNSSVHILNTKSSSFPGVGWTPPCLWSCFFFLKCRDGEESVWFRDFRVFAFLWFDVAASSCDLHCTGTVCAECEVARIRVSKIGSQKWNAPSGSGICNFLKPKSSSICSLFLTDALHTLAYCNIS